MASATSDTIIFMFLGMVLVSDEHMWHTGFVLWSVGLCFIFRFIGVFLLTGVMNHYRIKKINYEEQFIAAYGGLRGAVAFSLVNMLNSDLPSRRIFVTTTLVVILFTIFVQGITIKPLVNFLQIQRKRSDRKNLNEEIHDTAMDHIMAGIEEVLGQHGDFYLRALMIYYNDQYLNKWFVRPTCESKLTRLFEKIAISEHYAHLYGPVAMIEDKVKPLCPTENTTVKRVRSSSISPSYKDEVLLEPRLILEGEQDDTSLMQDGVQLRKSLKKKKSKSFIPIRYNSHRVGASEAFSDDEEGEDDQVFVGDDVEVTQKKRSNDAAQALRRAFRDNPYNKGRELLWGILKPYYIISFVAIVATFYV
ncbi:hypothetical protein SK128_027390 [Halocaridina rubra]|uniref:Cation/H+ exchanger transmembrane domain-containing protein n=1 Tax=Halocaridina rubra TaxID=373956 RepID=A0AAN8XW42_HALRR